MPVYVVLFYVPNLVMSIVRRSRNGRPKDPAAATRVVEQA
jgi:hypothetical protein